MGFKENINRICAEQGTYLSTVVKEVKGSSSFVTRINSGSLPKEDEMVEMAKILKCSVIDFFMDEEDLAYAENYNSQQVEPANEDEEDLLNIYRSLSRREKHEFMSLAYDFENRCNSDGE